MPRGLVLLIVVAAAASTQAAYSDCFLTLNYARDAVSATAWSACSPQYTVDLGIFTKMDCNLYAKSYNAPKCDPVIANYMKCAVKAVGLLKADNTFDDAAFKATTLQNKCSADAKFIAAYPKCMNYTMKYMNVGRLIACLVSAVY
ncbi:uncharacterized protein LOC108666760 [Hyalella azteca]|uniref:Uncharacterized protein LOC108666760 n=1 Tax=Hyalella azteca TaxID=294128 RepID=A0A8B7N7B5_HYAAZ|nr:uncharacterized protein LOC108666760 [Hyalella azteca]